MQTLAVGLYGKAAQQFIHGIINNDPVTFYHDYFLWDITHLPVASLDMVHSPSL